MDATLNSATNTLYIIWTIASKDVIESLKNRLIISLVAGLGFMLLMPKALSFLLEPPQTILVTYDGGDSQLVTDLENGGEFQVRRATSLSRLKSTVGSTGVGPGPQIGVAIPENFDQALEDGGELQVEGYIAWQNRHKSGAMAADLEAHLQRIYDRPIRVNTVGNLVHPPPDSLLLGMVTWTAVIVIILMGLNLVPSLFFEEKQTETMEALLVSPATAGQVVAGKAVAGWFYIWVSSAVVFAVYWRGVVHWEAALAFALFSGLFCVSLGLVIGMSFERQQDVLGLNMLITVLLVGAIFVNLVDLNMPAMVRDIVSWIPSVSLFELMRMAFLEQADWARIWPALPSIIVVSCLLYVVVLWRVRRTGR